MKKQNHHRDDDLFTEDDDPLWNEPGASPQPGKSRRAPMRGPFYLCSESWADAAALVCGHYLILALRLYRRWLKRGTATTVAVTAAALAGPGHSQRGRLRVVARLRGGRAYRGGGAGA